MTSQSPFTSAVWGKRYIESKWWLRLSVAYLTFPFVLHGGKKSHITLGLLQKWELTLLERTKRAVSLIMLYLYLAAGPFQCKILIQWNRASSRPSSRHLLSPYSTLYCTCFGSSGDRLGSHKTKFSTQTTERNIKKLVCLNGELNFNSLNACFRVTACHESCQSTRLLLIRYHLIKHFNKNLSTVRQNRK